MIKTKKLMLTLTTAFLMMFAVAVVSAASLSYSGLVQPSSVNHDDGTFVITFDLTNAGEAASITWTKSMSENQATMTFSDNSIGDGSVTPVTKSITATVSFSSYQDGNLAGTITADPSGPGSSLDIPFSVPINEVRELEVSDPTTITPSQDSTFTIENTGNLALTPEITIDSLDYNGGLDFEYELDGTANIPAGESREVTITSNIPGGEESLLAGQTTSITISATGIDEDITKTLKVEGSYCEVGDIGDLEIKKVDFNNDEGIGDDDEWYLFDKITIDIEVENTAEKDIDDIIVEWGLYDKDAGKFIFEEEEDDFDLEEKGEDDEKELTVSFTLDPDDFDEDYGEGDFAFIVKAYSDDKDEGEDVQCVSQVKDDFDVKKEDDYVIVRDITLVSETVPCNQILEGEFEVWNIGGDDQEELLVTVENEELGINEEIEIGDLEVLDDKKLPFSVKIPKDAVEKFYVLRVVIREDDRDVFKNGDDDEEAIFDSPVFDVSGSCIGAEADVEITAVLDPETPDAVAGKQIIVKATLRNKGDKEATYTVSVEGNSAWSNLVAIDPQVVTIAAGESQDINLILSINSDAEGEKDFTIKATTDGRIKTQPFGVTVTTIKDQATEVADHIRENWFIYLIIIVNIILIIAIIIVIRRMVAPAPM